jgi:hypothetical protein
VAFYPPVTWKVMNMCACNAPPPPLPPGEIVMKRTRPCACDPAYGDKSAIFATRQLPRWGMPAFVPALKPAAPSSSGLGGLNGYYSIGAADVDAFVPGDATVEAYKPSYAKLILSSVVGCLPFLGVGIAAGYLYGRKG